MSKKFDWGRKVVPDQKDRSLKHDFHRKTRGKGESLVDMGTPDLEALRAEIKRLSGGKK